MNDTFPKPRQFRGVDNSHWKGGRIKNVEGYILIHKPNHHYAVYDGYVREHRLVWEEHRNAILLPWAHVHHKDGNKQNNVWYNLQAMTNSQHTSFHRRLHVKKHKLNYN